MPSQRPFLANLFSAFHAHNAFKSAASGGASAPAVPSSNTASSLASQSAQPTATTTASPSAPRAISTATKPPTSPLSAAATAAFSPPGTRHHSSPGHTTSTPLPISRNPNSAFSGGPGRRRGSDSSSEGSGGSMGSGAGFCDTLGAEKWFIGGRTAAGEERFYKLAMIRRDCSRDRASLDRMSL